MRPSVPVPALRRPASRHRIAAAALGLVLSLGGVALAPGAEARAAPDSFAPLVKRVLPSVVNIAVTEVVNGNDVAGELPPQLRGTPFEKQFRERFRNRSEQIEGAGSGFIVDPSGIIVTNNHVVAHARTIIVTLADGTTDLPARVIGSDDLTDIAVLKVSAPRPLPAVPWGDSHSVEVGDWILAAGNPFGLGGSVTAGIVSARGRDIGAGPFDDFLQLDAPINPGNSGGPTFNLDGQVVALNTAIVSPTGGSVGIGFAIPSEIVAPIVARLRDGGHIDRGWLGVSIPEPEADPKSDPKGDPGGVRVGGVDRNGPAGRAGLRTGDVITALNGEHVDNPRTLVRTVAEIPPGNNVRLSVRRQNQTLDIPVTVGKRPPTNQD